jgi:DNA (cytosine-5)-methyltransferase 1
VRAIEVCCGAGGTSLGLKRAGFKIGLAIDIWSDALKIYRQNLKSPAIFSRPGKVAARVAAKRDLANLLALIPQALDHRYDMVVGSPPCQDFSSAGSRSEGARADITVAFAIFVAALRPRWVLMENVREAKSSEVYRRAREILKQSGYGLTEQVVDASFYGVAQARRRFIVIGRLDEADGFLDSALKEARSEKPLTVRDLLGDDVGVHPGDSKYSPETRAYFMRPYSGEPGVRSIDAPCPTITRNSNGKASRHYMRHEHDMARGQDVPSLSLEQISRLQGFPPSWNWDGLSKAKRAIMIANAVPAPLAEALGRLIKEREQGKSFPAIEPEFVRWLTRSKKLTDQSLRNRKTYLNRGRRLLKGRILADIDLELALLETNPEFAALSPSVKSDIRLALRSHAEWRETVRLKVFKKNAKLLKRDADIDNDYEELENLPAPKLKIGSKKAA